MEQTRGWRYQFFNQVFQGLIAIIVIVYCSLRLPEGKYLKLSLVVPIYYISYWSNPSMIIIKSMLGPIRTSQMLVVALDRND
jgi:hypothetical protein